MFMYLPNPGLSASNNGGRNGIHCCQQCQETSSRDTANKYSLELCASIVLLPLDGCSEWCVSVVFLTGQVLGN